MQFKTKCIAAFGKCRKYEDVVGEVVGVCSRDPTKVIISLRIAIQNVDKAIQVKPKLTMVMKGIKVLNRRPHSSRALSCSDFGEIVTAFMKVFSVNFKNPKVSTMADEIMNSTVAVCTDEDKNSLRVAEQNLDETIREANDYIKENQATLSGEFDECLICFFCFYDFPVFRTDWFHGILCYHCCCNH